MTNTNELTAKLKVAAGGGWGERTMMFLCWSLSVHVR